MNSSENSGASSALAVGACSALSLRPAGKTYDDQPRYDVMAGETIVGRIEGHHPTFERRSPGKRYVNARWTSNKRYWRAVNLEGRTVGRAYETRKGAMRCFEQNTTMSHDGR